MSATVVSEWPAGAKPKYAKFLDGRIWVVSPTDVGLSTPQRLQTALHNAARGLRVSVRTAIVEGVVYVQKIDGGQK